jgi:eukaryotic-like serine/threonine-protein kinase
VPLSTGEKLGPYEIIAPLGAGGMGEVYRARDTRLNRDVALKILPEDPAKDPSRRARFEQEARAVAAINHPNIVAIYDVGDGYIVSELIDGEPLRGGKPGLRRTIEIAVQIASGLAAAHDAGIVHRDLKPDNILLTKDGRPKILDFGLAKMQPTRVAAEGETVTVRTEPGVVMGTPGYMSPEQVRGLATDHRSDIFSFGVILHELLSGKRAFHGETSMDTMQAILRDEAPELPESLPAGVRQIVAHCLEKEASRRFQSAHDLGFALSASGQSGSHPSLTPVRSSRRRWVLPAAVAIALLAGLAAGKLLMRDAASPQWSGVMLGGPEMALYPRLSPDGHLLAFQVIDNGMPQVAVMKPESGNWSTLTHRRDSGIITVVCWSPDGSLLYYDRMTGVPNGVFSVPVLGGEEHLVLENAGAPESLPDGSLLIDRVNANRQYQVYRFWPETGRLLEFPLELSQESGASPHSRVTQSGNEAVTFASAIGPGGQGLGLYAINLATNTVRRLALSERDAAALEAWTVARDGKSLLAALPAGSLTRLVAIPIGGQVAPRTLFTVANLVWSIDEAADRSLFIGLVDRPQEVVRLSEGGSDPPERIAAFPVGSDFDEVLLLPDGRTVTPASARGRLRLMAAEKGKDALPLVNTQEENTAPMTLAGPREIAFVIGPAPFLTIALADVASGRITHRISPGKGVIDWLTASADGGTLYFCAGGSVWAVSSAGGAPRAVSTGEAAVMEPSGRSLIVVRGESSHARMLRVPLDGAAETEIPPDSSSPLFAGNGGFLSSGSIDARGRLLISITPVDSWFNPIGILDTATGRITRVPGDILSDHHSAVWAPGGKIVSTRTGLRATMWKFTPEGK